MNYLMQPSQGSYDAGRGHERVKIIGQSPIAGEGQSQADCPEDRAVISVEYCPHPQEKELGDIGQEGWEVMMCPETWCPVLNGYPKGRGSFLEEKLDLATGEM